MSHAEFLTAPLHAPAAYAAVVDRIRRALALGVLLPGDLLPPERTLAEGMGISRVTVREALRILQGEGVLVTRRGSGGTTVAPGIGTVQPGTAAHQQRLRDVFELRLAVEAMAARLAAQRVTEADIEQLDECQAAMATSTDVHSFRRADSDFHLTLARLSGNDLLRQSIEDARAAAFSSLDRRNFTVLHESSMHWHASVLDAIRRHDPEAAAGAMSAHIMQARDEVRAALAETELRDGPARATTQPSA